MNNIKPAILEFNPALKEKIKGKKLSKGLSAVLLTGNQLWIANDESISLERLSLKKEMEGAGILFSDHQQFLLSDYISLTVPPSGDLSETPEVDIEGLDYRDGYLWLVGSHSLKRSKPDNIKTPEKNIERLARVSSDGNRYLLARIPLVKLEGYFTLQKHTDQNGIMRLAGQLAGSDVDNDLTKALSMDEHLQPFLTIPGKDNGFDIEGLAIGNNGQIYIGLRGPVLRGWAVILELYLEANADKPSELKLQNINPDNTEQPFYRKHFLDLGGMGIRDLCMDGADLLILAGPTMDLDGPVTIFRWKVGLADTVESVTWCDTQMLEKQMDIQFGQGADHAEGMGIFEKEDDKIRSVIVVHDAASENRQKIADTLEADIITLHG